VIVEDNGPIPRVLRPTLISGSERFPSSLAVAPDGKFTASWPAGDQRVEFSPDSDYALQSARYGQADLLAGPLKINPTGAGELTITLRVTQPLFPVSGRVEGIAQLRAANPRTTYRVTLIPERSGAGLNRNPAESQIAADGTFEFPKVLPGKYTVRLNPDVTGVSQAVTVTYLPVRDITLPVPKR
jgi:hypothetical protein